jgi:hypothetical protein
MLLFVSVSSIALIAACSTSPSSPPATATAGTVTLRFAIDGRQREVRVSEIRQGTSLESVMRQVEDPEIIIRGSGTTAFVDSIGGIPTSASEGWTFRVDGRFADRGIGTMVLDPPTTVTWSFGEMEPTDSP